MSNLIVNRKITLDLLDKTSTIKVYAKRLDNLARHLTVTIVKGSESFTVPTDANIRFQGTKPDNTSFCNNCKLNSDGTIDVELTAQILAVSGVAKCEIEIENKDGLITASTFNLNIVDKALSPDVIKSTDEYRSIYSMLLEVRDYLETIETDSQIASQKADEAKASAQLADDVVNCVPIAWVVDNFKSTDKDHALSANAGRLLDQNKVDKIDGKGLSTHDLTDSLYNKLVNSDDSATHTVIVDDLNSTVATYALSANQGHVLDEKVKSLTSAPRVFTTDAFPSSGMKDGDVCIRNDGQIARYSSEQKAWIAYLPKTDLANISDMHGFMRYYVVNDGKSGMTYKSGFEDQNANYSTTGFAGKRRTIFILNNVSKTVAVNSNFVGNIKAAVFYDFIQLLPELTPKTEFVLPGITQDHSTFEFQVQPTGFVRLWALRERTKSNGWMFATGTYSLLAPDTTV